MKIKYILLVVILGFYSCDNFLEEYSQDLVHVQSASDLDEVLIKDGYMPNKNYLFDIKSSSFQVFGYLNVLDDDVNRFGYYSSYGLNRDNSMDNAHLWQQDVFSYNGEPLEDYSWTKIYKHINVLNVIIGAADNLSDDDINQVNRVKGESLFLRAYYYFLAVNIYGQPYSAENKATLGVPLKLTDNVITGEFKRNTVEECYAQILDDLTKAMELLEDNSIDNVYRGSYQAATALMSKVYLYMQDYNNAVKYADLAISTGSRRISTYNYNQSNYFLNKENDEIIFSTGYNSISEDRFMTTQTYGGINCYVPSSDLINSFQAGDLRLNQFKNDSYHGRYYSIKGSRFDSYAVSNICPIRLSEIYLIRAEASAMIGDEAMAKNDLNYLFSFRYEDGMYPDLNISGETLMNLIRAERRRELCFEGQRWFDLRRYAVNDKYPFSKQITHNQISMNDSDFGQTIGTVTLETYDIDRDAYVMQIPREVLDFNKSMKGNPIRPDKTIN